MRINEIITEANINQQLSRYHPETRTYRGSYNTIPTSTSVGADDITARLKQADQYSDDEMYDKDAHDSYGSISNTEKNIDRESLKKLIAPAMDTLLPREKQVLALRYWKDYDLDETATRMQLSIERVRQIEAKALRKLKHPRHSDAFRSALGLNTVRYDTTANGAYSQGVQDGYHNATPQNYGSELQSHYQTGYLSGKAERDAKTGTPSYLSKRMT